MTMILNKYFKVLDHGFIALKDYMGSDEDIEQAARVSYGKGTRKTSDTRNLIRYLIRHKHTSPLEMAELKLHVRVPIHIWRQWIRHRTASVNEHSTRYSEAISLKEQTNRDEWRLQSRSNKQGSNKFLIEEDGGAYCGKVLTDEEVYLHSLSDRVYQHRLESGIAREQARKDLPLSTYTEAYWKIDLHNLLHFCNLRCDSHAQFEIRQYANIIAAIIKELFPITYEAWLDYVFNGISFSRMDMELVYNLLGTINNNQVIENAQKLGMSKREVSEFFDKLIPKNNNFNLPIEYYNLQELEEVDYAKRNNVG